MADADGGTMDLLVTRVGADAPDSIPLGGWTVPQGEEAPGIWHGYELVRLGDRVELWIDGVQAVAADLPFDFDGQLGLAVWAGDPSGYVDFDGFRVCGLDDGTFESLWPWSDDT